MSSRRIQKREKELNERKVMGSYKPHCHNGCILVETLFIIISVHHSSFVMFTECDYDAHQLTHRGFWKLGGKPFHELIKERELVVSLITVVCEKGFNSLF